MVSRLPSVPLSDSFVLLCYGYDVCVIREDCDCDEILIVIFLHIPRTVLIWWTESMDG